MAAENSNFHSLRSSSIKGQVVFHWRSSSLKLFFTLVWSPMIMFNIWWRSDQWVLRYSIFPIFRSSSIGGHLPLKVVVIETFFLLWFGPMSLYLKFEEDPISGCWDIQIFIFWELFPHRWGGWVVYGQISLRSSSIKGRLPLKVVFIGTFFYFGLVHYDYI